MELDHNTGTVRTSLTYVYMKKSASWVAFLCNISRERSLKLSRRHSKTTSSPNQSATTVQWSNHDSTPTAFQIFILNIRASMITKRNLNIFSNVFLTSRKYHSFEPISKDKVNVSFYSSSNTFKEEMVTLAHNDLSLDSIHGFVTCSSGGKWWLGRVIELF